MKSKFPPFHLLPMFMCKTCFDMLWGKDIRWTRHCRDIYDVFVMTMNVIWDNRECNCHDIYITSEYGKRLMKEDSDLYRAGIKH